jgi:ubiquinone/menaquinone biosynthesis C-methylase UbiE
MNKRIIWQIEWVQKWPHFHKADKILEVGSGTFETIAFLATKYPEKQFIGVDFVFGKDAAPVLKNAPKNLTAIKHDIRDLGLFSDECFDFAYSVAVMEHIRELEAHLMAIYKVLKKGGKYSFMESPFWSSSLGHHYDHNAPDCPIPPYGHLYMSRDELHSFLGTIAGKDSLEIGKILKRIYDRKDLSRLSRTETKNIITSSPFIVESWTEKIDANYSDQLAEAVLKNNVYNLDAKDLPVSGVVCTLVKPPEIAAEPRWQEKLASILGIRK